MRMRFGGAAATQLHLDSPLFPMRLPVLGGVLWAGLIAQDARLRSLLSVGADVHASEPRPARRIRHVVGILRAECCDRASLRPLLWRRSPLFPCMLPTKKFRAAR